MQRQLLFIRAAVFLGVCFGLSCDGEDDPQERITKLRALGVASIPAVAGAAALAGVAELTFYAAVPLGKTVTFTAFSDSEAKYSFPQAVTVIAGSDTYKDYGAFRLFSLKATLVIPPIDTLKIPTGQSQRLRYGMKLNSDEEEEKVVGDVLVFPAGAEQTAWKSPSAEIEAPSESAAADNEADLKGKIAKPQNEKIKVGWFVSGGSVKNRRAAVTSWTTPGVGNHTVVMTVHGAESRGFGIFVKDVQIK